LSWPCVVATTPYLSSAGAICTFVLGGWFPDWVPMQCQTHNPGKMVVVFHRALGTGLF